jgi:Tol biopolymer transport system component
MLKLFALLVCFALWPLRALPAPAPQSALGHSSAATAPDSGSLPLHPTRKVEFTTDEGTWISLDVSPDGNAIIFELLGHIYEVPIAGGTASQITTGLAWDSQPRFSPDGSSIVFLSDRGGSENVWIAKPDGTQLKEITHDKRSVFTSPIWTCDNRAIIVSREPRLSLGDFELWLYYVDGGSGVQVTKGRSKADARSEDAVHALGPILAPDGQYLYYTRRPNSSRIFDANMPPTQIVRRNLATGQEDTITEALGNAFRPLISPDGKHLVYGTRYGGGTALRIRDLNSGEERWLKYPVQRDNEEAFFTSDLLPGYAFTPDGKYVVISYGGKIHRIAAENGDDQIIPFEAKINREIGPQLNIPRRVDEGPIRARLIQDPSLSPDGKRITFSALTHVYTMNVPGGSPTRLTKLEDREFQPAWSPDGQWIAYVTWAERQGGEIWKARADGTGTPVKLTEQPGYYSQPAWSPDGTRVVALRGEREAHVEEVSDSFVPPARTDLIFVDAQGGEALIAPARGAAHPHFGPQQDRIYFYTLGGLVSVRWDGMDRRQELQVTGKPTYFEPAGSPESQADDVRISPDGNWALARVNYQLFIVAVPHVGSDAPRINVWSPSVPSKKITDVGADYFAWSKDGKEITWAVGSSFFRRSLDSLALDASANATTKSASASPAEEFDVSIEIPRYRPTGTVVLQNARIITMKGDQVLDNADIVIKDNRIAAIGPHAAAAAALPAGAKIIDLAGSTIVPGFIDLHPHWWQIRRGVLDMQNWDFLAALAYGVTAGRDPQTFTNDMFVYQDLVDSGEMIGPRAYSTGPGIFWDTDFQSLDDAKNIVEKYKKFYRTNYVKSYLVGNRQQREFMIEACAAFHLTPTTEGGRDEKLDLTHIIDGFNLEHSLPIVPVYKDVDQLMAQTGVFYTPTLIVSTGGPWAEDYFYNTTEVRNDPKMQRFVPANFLDRLTARRTWTRYDDQVFPKLAATDVNIVKAGGKIAIGSHGQLQGIGYHWEMWALASGGLSNLDVLRSATLRGAEALGLDQDLGSLEVGKLADLLVLNKNPLDDIHNTNTIRYVMKNGELFEGDTLNEIWPTEKPLPDLWWWHQP